MRVGIELADIDLDHAIQPRVAPLRQRLEEIPWLVARAVGDVAPELALGYSIGECAMFAALGVWTDLGELARRLEVPESEVVDMDRRLSGNDLSLDAPVGDSEGRSVEPG